MDKNKEKKEYELSFLIKQGSDNESMESLLNQYDAEIFFRGPVLEIKLAYPIKKNNLAYFGYFYFKTFPDSIEKIKQSLKLNPSVLRILVITPPITKDKKSRLRSEIKSVYKKPAEISPTVSGGILSNKALEEKLEEILK